MEHGRVEYVKKYLIQKMNYINIIISFMKMN